MTPATTYRQVDPYRTGCGAAELALRADHLDSHISRIDLVGKDAIVIKDGKQITEFRDGILPWALQKTISPFVSTNMTPAVPM